MCFIFLSKNLFFTKICYNFATEEFKKRETHSMRSQNTHFLF